MVVDTSGNTVTLTGHVRTWAEHDAAVDAAWMAAGVYDVPTTCRHRLTGGHAEARPRRTSVPGPAVDRNR